MFKYRKQIYLPITRNEFQTLLRNNRIEIGNTLYYALDNIQDGDRFVFSAERQSVVIHNSAIPAIEMKASDAPDGVLVDAVFSFQKPVFIISVCLSILAILMQILVIASLFVEQRTISVPVFIPIAILLFWAGFMNISLRLESVRFLNAFRKTLTGN